MPDSPSFDPTVPRRGGRRGQPARVDDVAPTLPASQRATVRAGSARVAGATPPAGRSDRFAIGAELGRGGMGTVRLAEDPALQRELAVKFLQAPGADSAAQFVEEAQITAQLQHPNIVPVYELGHDASGRPWLAMKRIEGESLAETIAGWKQAGRARLRQEDLNTILGIFGKVCDALAFAHSRGVIHRDIKPHNIMVGAYGEVLLVDWGLAKPLGRRPDDDHVDSGDDDVAAPPTQAVTRTGMPTRQATRHSRAASAITGPATVPGQRPVRSTRRSDTRQPLTLDGDIFGTPAYMPPEQAEGRVDEIDERSDIFSLAGVLYHMLALEAPYSGRNATDTLANAARHKLVPPRRRNPAAGIPKELQSIVLKAMAAEPADRYATVADLQADLAAWQAFRRTTAWRSGPLERLIKWTRRHPTASMAGALLLFAGLVVAVLLSQLDRERERGLRADADRALAEERERVALAGRDYIGGRVVELLDQQTRDSMADFNRRWNEARTAHITDADFGRSLTDAEVAGYLRAFNLLFDVRARVDQRPSVDEYFQRALILQFAGRLDEAIVDYQEALRARPDYMDAHYNIGLLRQAQGRLDDAIARYNEALRIDPGLERTWLNRGLARVEQGRLDDALADYDAALKINPRFAMAHYNRAAVLQEQGRTDEALAGYNTALQLDPRLAEAYCNRGQVKRTLGDVDGAFEDFERALAADPKLAKGYCNRGATRQSLGRIDDALADYNEALRLDPALAMALVGRGTIRKTRGQLDEAVADFNEALRIDPHTHDAYTHRAACRQLLGRIDEAIADYTAALQIQPRNAVSLNNRGHAYQAKGKLDAAIADFDAALAINARYTTPLVNRGMARHAQGRFADAIADYTSALAIDPEMVDAYYSRGNARLAANQLDDALADFDATLRLNPNLWSAAANRGTVFARLNRMDDALAAFLQAYPLCKDPAMRGKLAEAIRQLGGTVPDGPGGD